MQEVCKNVQFTNGSATAELRSYDWGISNLLDKIRYEEDFKINIDEYFQNFYRIKKEFIDWCKKKYKTTDLKINWYKLVENEDLKEYTSITKNDLLYWDEGIQKFSEFRNKSGKKDRSDHRHHAIDAFVTACCSPKTIKELSTYNAIRENQHIRDRDKIARAFNYEQLKEIIASIFVSHSEKQTLIKKRKNRIKTKEGIIEHINYAPQGKLHEESFYAKRNDATVRRVELFDDQRKEKALFTDITKLDYVVKKEVKWHYIEDDQLYKITKQRLEELKSKAFSKDEMEKRPFYRTSPETPEKLVSNKTGKPLPIVKSIRKRFNSDRTLINLPAKDENGKIINENRYVDNDSNAIMILYENLIIDKKGNYKKPEREFEILSFFKAVSSKNPHNKIYYTEGKLFKDEKNEAGLKKECKWLKSGDLVLLYKNEDDRKNLDWNNHQDLKERFFIVKGISSSVVTTGGKEYDFGYVSLLKIRISKSESYPSEKEIGECLHLKSFKLSHKKLNAIKVRLNILGEIEARGEECF